jgi:hypothetical protein
VGFAAKQRLAAPAAPGSPLGPHRSASPAAQQAVSAPRSAYANGVSTCRNASGFDAAAAEVVDGVHRLRELALIARAEQDPHGAHALRRHVNAYRKSKPRKEKRQPLLRS